MKIKGLLFIVLALVLFNCNKAEKETTDKKEKNREKFRAKFEPEDGEVILFIGQELDAIGGTEDYNNGYMDYFQPPGGITMYTDIMPGLKETFLDKSFTYSGLNGIWETDDWGDGDENMSLVLEDSDFKYCALAIGLAIIDNEEKIAEGVHDGYIEKMGNFFKDTLIKYFRRKKWPKKNRLLLRQKSSSFLIF